MTSVEDAPTFQLVIKPLTDLVRLLVTHSGPWVSPMGREIATGKGRGFPRPKMDQSFSKACDAESSVLTDRFRPGRPGGFQRSPYTVVVTAFRCSKKKRTISREASGPRGSV